MKENTTEQRARLATLGQLRATIFKAYLDPVPCDDTCRDWLDQWKVPRIKSNPHAKRGGGLVFYNVAAVERGLKKELPGRLAPVEPEQEAA
jgi:hypothetical protein